MLVIRMRSNHCAGLQSLRDTLKEVIPAKQEQLKKLVDIRSFRTYVALLIAPALFRKRNMEAPWSVMSRQFDFPHSFPIRALIDASFLLRLIISLVV